MEKQTKTESFDSHMRFKFQIFIQWMIIDDQDMK